MSALFLSIAALALLNALRLALCKVDCKSISQRIVRATKGRTKPVCQFVS